jgi:hypothetical protein
MFALRFTRGAVSHTTRLHLLELVCDQLLMSQLDQDTAQAMLVQAYQSVDQWWWPEVPSRERKGAWKN